MILIKGNSYGPIPWCFVTREKFVWTTILFEIITFLIRKPLNHVTVIAKNAWESPRGIISCNSILQEKQGDCNCNAS